MVYVNFSVVKEGEGIGTVRQASHVGCYAGEDAPLAGAGIKEVRPWEGPGEAERYVMALNERYMDEGCFGCVCEDGRVVEEYRDGMFIDRGSFSSAENRLDVYAYAVDEKSSKGLAPTHDNVMRRERARVLTLTGDGVAVGDMGMLSPERQADAKKTIVSVLNRYGREMNGDLKERNITFDGWEDVERYASFPRGRDGRGEGAPGKTGPGAWRLEGAGSRYDPDPDYVITVNRAERGAYDYEIYDGNMLRRCAGRVRADGAEEAMEEAAFTEELCYDRAVPLDYGAARAGIEQGGRYAVVMDGSYVICEVENGKYGAEIGRTDSLEDALRQRNFLNSMAHDIGGERPEREEKERGRGR